MTAPAKSGFFHRAVRSLIEARERQAALYVNSVLLSLDDETLKANGYSRAELSKRQRANRAWL